ncbi:heparan sulfate 2-O-sulfotransferase pipe-like [Palaemon carinicauda]|uniref:heparan sulfate 2-O-sulfotransferase pipe-like n=1 Tax=Palaemon carinicauda TaxID=392227 RepID=UPI0035B637ED
MYRKIYEPRRMLVALASIFLWLVFLIFLQNYQAKTGRKFQAKREVQISLKTKSLDVSKFVSAVPLHPRLLIYNRVPKCGSSTMIGLLIELSKLNGFVHLHSGNYRDIWLNRTVLEHMKLEWLTISKSMRLSYDRHMLYFNLDGFKEGEAAWMNLVRDPVERFISRFYYKQQNEATEVIKNLDSCVDTNVSECIPATINYTESQISYFCGHELQCLTLEDGWALQKAKANVEKFYSVVGILEDLHTTFQVLQHVLPDFFTNYQFTFHGIGRIVANKRSENFQPPVSNVTKKFLRSYLREEIEFYKFIKRRLYVQAKMIALSTNDTSYDLET